MSTKKTEERKEVNPKETEVWTVHANNPRKHELNRAYNDKAPLFE